MMYGRMAGHIKSIRVGTEIAPNRYGTGRKSLIPQFCPDLYPHRHRGITGLTVEDEDRIV
jgi:hypothetical protein